jgi:hypothetical protein
LSEQNKQIVLDYVEAFNGGDIDALCTLFITDALVYGVLGWGDLDKVKPVWQEIIQTNGVAA